MNYYLLAGVIGLFSGLISGLFGVGGGLVMVPAMMYFMKLDIKMAVGTSLVVIIPTALMGAFKHNQLNHVDWRLAAAIIPLAIIGAALGAWLTDPIHATHLRRAFGGFVVLVGLRLVFFK